MTENVRCEQRRFIDWFYAVVWKQADGAQRSTRVRGIDISRSGLRIECDNEFQPGSLLTLQAEKNHFFGDATVRHCTRRGTNYVTGLEFSSDAKGRVQVPDDDAVDHYEVLQISPNAESDTIHRVYRIMAARFHPDNPETGDAERFVRLTRAYQTLSDPERRAEYDALGRIRVTEPLPIFELKEFVDGVEGEVNRRLGVLSLLYNKRRINLDYPGVSLLDLERRMSFPREYLSFTMWYLQSKGYVRMEENSDFSLTSAGADYVEANSAVGTIVNKLLTCRTGSQRSAAADTRVQEMRQLPGGAPSGATE
jgi:curved DNA-binding protein CbpA